MRRDVTGGGVVARVQVGTGTGRPVTRGGLEEAPGHRDGDGGRRGWHEVELGVAVARHEEVALVFVGRRVRRGRLRGRCQALEVELVGVPLPVHLGHDIFVVVVPAISDSSNL